MRRLKIISLSAVGLIAAVYAVQATAPAATAGDRAAAPAEAALVASELAKLPAQAHLTARIDVPPPSVSSAVPPGEAWLDLTSTAVDESDAIQAEWYAAAVVRAYATDAAPAGAPALAGGSVIVTNASGAVLDKNSWLDPNSTPAETPDAPSSIVGRLQSGAASAGVRLDSVALMNIPTLSVALTIEVDDPSRFAQHAGRAITALTDGPRGLDGILIRVVDRAGAPFLVAAYSNSLRSGSVWLKPGMSSDVDL